MPEIVKTSNTKLLSIFLRCNHCGTREIFITTCSKSLICMLPRCQNLIFRVLSQWEILSLVTIWVFVFYIKWVFFCFVKIWLKFCHYWKFVPVWIWWSRFFLWKDFVVRKEKKNYIFSRHILIKLKNSIDAFFVCKQVYW